jgi:predicted nucleic acid-binding protein
VRQAQFLVDTSALVRILRQRDVRLEWEEPISAGLVATCPVTELELLYTVRSKADREDQLAVLRDTFVWVVMPDRAFDRAADVQAALTDRGAQRSAGPVDLLTAAAAEAHGMVLLHYDADFAQIAEVTGQQVRWLAEPGTID